MPLPHRRQPRAFTLIELVVVIGIIAVLIGLTVTVVSRVRRAAYGASTSAQLTTIANAITQYYADFRAYPGPLSNIQLGGAYQVGGPIMPTITDPSGGATPLQLQYYDPVAKTAGPFPGTSETQHITGAENLVLGLIGGLQLQTPGGVQFVYNPASIFSDVPSDQTPAAQGAMSLNYSKPSRTPAYLQVRPGDISHPNSTVNNGQFTDTANRPATDSIIPEFVDQYGDQMPILYLRANAGAASIASIGGADDGGTALTAPAQYDLAQILDYTRSKIFTTANNTNLNHHGLQGLGDPNLTDTILGIPPTGPGGPTGWYNAGKNALAYLKDPNNPGTSNAPSTTPPTSGNARQKDGYILISAGPDRIYGTPDDIIYPGSLQP
jgi:prepilin-type N-terminal cleavage/methylation domain-containing protein